MENTKLPLAVVNYRWHIRQQLTTAAIWIIRTQKLQFLVTVTHVKLLKYNQKSPKLQFARKSS